MSATFTYDGRSFLSRVERATGAEFTEPTYSSDGLLHSLTRQGPVPEPLETVDYFYFSGRPVAQLRDDGTTATWTFLTTDHLGTPLLATDLTANEVWRGPFEPFGRDINQAAPNSARGQGIFLSFPGQWDDGRWQDASAGADLYYNVHRWYEFGTGRYGRVDPLGKDGDFNPYAYAVANPTGLIDPLGEKSRVCCTPVEAFGIRLENRKHCFIEVEDDTTRQKMTYSLHRVNGKGCTFKDDPFDFYAPDDGTLDCGDWNEDCGTDDCAKQQFANYPNPSDYQFIRGPNSNSFARTAADACGLTPPSIAGTKGTPGWDKVGRPAKNKRFQCPRERN